MKIYVGASYPKKAIATALANELVMRGHSVTSTWIHQDEGYTSDENRPNETEFEMDFRLGEAAFRDLQEVRDCELFVCFTDVGPQLTHGGRHSELGIAIALGKELNIIGPREQVFHYLGTLNQYDTSEDFLRELE